MHCYITQYFFFLNDNFLKLIFSIIPFRRFCVGMTSGIHGLILDLFIPYSQPSSVVLRDPFRPIKKEGVGTTPSSVNIFCEIIF